MPASLYSLTDIARVADTTPRTVRYYIQQGLLPAPAGAGPGAHYNDAHLGRLRLIKRLQREHLPLAEIRSRLLALGDDEIARLAGDEGADRSDSALEYVRSLLGSRGVPTANVHAARAMVAEILPGASPAPSPTGAGHAQTRSQWERVELAPDIELHLRRPLSRRNAKQVERLIARARQLFVEGQP